MNATPAAVMLRDITLHDPTTGRQWLKLDEARWTPTWSDLPRGVLGSIQVKGALLDLDRATFDSLTKPSGPPAGNTAAGTPGLILEKLMLAGVRVKIAASESMPGVEFTVDQQGGGIDLSDPLHPAVKSFATSIHDVIMGDAREATLASLQMKGSLGRDDGILRLSALSVGEGTLIPSKALLELLGKPSTTQGKTGPSPIKGVELAQATLQGVELRPATDEAMPEWWPKVTGKVSGSISGLSWSEAKGLTMGRHDLQVSNLELKPPSGSGVVSLAEGKVSMQGGSDGKLRVLSGELEKAVIDWTPELEAWFMPVKPASSVPATPSSGMELMVEGFSIHDAALSLKRTPKVGYEGHVRLDLDLAGLTLGPRGWSSPKPQRLVVRDLSLAEHPASKALPMEPFARLEAGVLQVVPDAWNAGNGVAELTLQKPLIKIRNDNVSWFDDKPAASDASANVPVGEPWFKRLHFDQLKVEGGDCDLALALPQPMELRTQFALSTKDQIHRLSLHQVKGMLPKLAKLPVAGVEQLELAVQLPSLWKTKHIDELKIKGVELEVGDALMSLAKDDEQAKESELTGPPEPSPLSDWRVNKLSIDDAAVTLQRVAPGLPPMKFNIDYEAADMPLNPAELAGNFKPQRIELSQLGIKSPYNPLREVARLDTVFVDFTLDGLFKQRIDQIEIVSPTLNVGEDLFWYIDYYRKYAAGETLPNPNQQVAGTSTFAALEAATAAAEAPEKQAHAWTINTLAVHGGKLVIAPKGVPLAGIPRPFPFSFVSKLDKGQIDAEFDIPSDTYVWEDLKLALEGMRGHVLFNLPVKGQDNNLTETFNVDRIRYKQLHLEQGHLSVTYDVNGIYGKFGGAAYEGYVSGAFNVYLDQSFSWDGWISGIGVRSTEITQKISPAYFLLDGKVDLTLVAQGDKDELYQCDIKFTNPTPGKFSIQALNDALKAIPTDAASYQRDIMRIGVETVRDFEYAKVDGQCRFYGREGKGHLHFVGPTGSRNIELNVYDHRWTPVKPPPQPAFHDPVADAETE